MGFDDWKPRLDELAEGILTRTRVRLAQAAETNDASIARPQGVGVGDLTFGLDEPGERFAREWHADVARETPVSLLTEDAGWRHLGPAPDGGAPRELPGFDHGGPRIALDPVDGTRNLMSELRSAWSVISFAPAGSGEPRLAELTGGMVAEIPPSRTTRFQRYWSDGSTTWKCEQALDDAGAPGPATEPIRVDVDVDDRPDHGYFPFFRFHPRERLALAAWEARFLQRLERDEGADLAHVYDDQYITNGGQLVLLMQGCYRIAFDLRALVARRTGVPTMTAKPYDVAGAILCARTAGCEVTGPEGEALDFPIDAKTPVAFCAYVNAATRRRLEPHWLAVVGG